MRPLDTSERAAAVQDDLHRALGPEARMQMALKMSDLAREFSFAGIRARHPESTTVEVSRRLIEELYGVALPR
ncbi:MAG TPA: hypothetical protein VEK79_16735 [Thermoanaerobaculia bacterium]|nr:hypothetical protein [Thermoanaerobaculia bacterium]